MLSTIKPKYDIIRNEIKNKNQDIENILKIFEKNFNDFNEVSHVKKPIKNARKLLKKNSENINEAINLIDESYKILENEIGNGIGQVGEIISNQIWNLLSSDQMVLISGREYRAIIILIPFA